MGKRKRMQLFEFKVHGLGKGNESYHIRGDYIGASIVQKDCKCRA